jgi:hypothetical protein
LKFDGLKVGEVYVHARAVTEEKEIVEVPLRFNRGLEIVEFDEGFPDLHFLEDQDLEGERDREGYSENFTVSREYSVEKVVTNDSSVFVVDANQDHRGSFNLCERLSCRTLEDLSDLRIQRNVHVGI